MWVDKIDSKGYWIAINEDRELHYLVVYENNDKDLYCEDEDCYDEQGLYNLNGYLVFSDEYLTENNNLMFLKIDLPQFKQKHTVEDEWYQSYCKMGGKHTRDKFDDNMSFFQKYIASPWALGECDRSKLAIKWLNYIKDKNESRIYFDAVNEVTPIS